MRKVSRHPHDTLVRRVFGNPKHARGELQHLLPKALSARINWSTLKVEPGAFVDEALKASYSDLLFSVELDGSKTFIYLLLEHLARPQRFLLFRLLGYLVRFLDRWLQDHPNATHLPVVIPILLCHGRTPWTYPLCFEELVNAPPDVRVLVQDFIPKFRALVDDLSTVSDDALRTRAMTEFGKVTLWCLKTATSTKDLLRTAELWETHLRSLLQSPSGAAAMSVVFRYMLSVHEGSEKTVLPKLAKALKMEDHQIMATIAEQLIAKGEKRGVKKGQKQGRKEGVELGRKEGVELGERTTLLRLLQRKFGSVPTQIIAQVNRANQTQLDTWVDRILTANTLADVFHR
ncbi:MAG: Rpn family recombination-promoting nuclease/putative transposase [Polyangiaceae bacterium]|nr:Rpn family recombination-promoting nuclease/putative transposase [Polyangiaceae bacterium]